MNFIIDTRGDTVKEPTPEDAALKTALKDYTTSNTRKTNPKKRYVDPQKQQQIDNLLKKSAVLTPEFETLQTVPEYEVSKKRLRQQRQAERDKTKGSKWFNMPATEITPEIKQDLQVLKMRSALDPKHFYKKNDLKVLPKYFQVGKILDSPLEFYNRVPNKDRKKSLVDELLADAEFNKYNKRKYKEIIDERQKTHYKAWRQAKKLRRKNKKK